MYRTGETLFFLKRYPKSHFDFCTNCVSTVCVIFVQVRVGGEDSSTVPEVHVPNRQKLRFKKRYPKSLFDFCTICASTVCVIFVQIKVDCEDVKYSTEDPLL